MIIPSIIWSCGIQLIFKWNIDIKFFLKSAIIGFWFLSTLFYLSIVSSVVERNFNKPHLFYLLIFIIMMFLPDLHGFMMIKFMYPFFIFGLFIGKYEIDLENIKWAIFVTSLVVWVLLLLNWDKKYFIYTSGMAYIDKPFLEQTIINGFRYIAGFSGTISVYYLVLLIRNYTKLINYFSKLGSLSFGIYIIQTFVFDNIGKLHKPSFIIDNVFAYNFLFTPLCATAVSIGCVLLIFQIQRFEFLNRILLGGRR